MKKDDKILDMVGIVNNKKLLQILAAESDSYKKLYLEKLKLLDYLAVATNKLIMPNVISSDTILEPNKTYLLQGSCRVEEGATLTISEGVVVEAFYLNEDINSQTYILVEKGAKININGTKSSPVTMQSNMHQAGYWGGLIILGCAGSLNEIGKPIKNQQFFDNSYGGIDENDNSGTINNLIIKHSGVSYTDDIRYAGLTLYGVGRNTQINNVAITDCMGDGLQINGGSIEMKNVYLSNIVLNSIYWNDGWNGTLDGVYIQNNILNFISGIYADGYDNRPILENVTLNSNINGTAFNFRYYSGVYINGLKITGYKTNFIRENFDDNDIRIEGHTPDNLTGNLPTMIDLQLGNTSHLINYNDRYLLPNKTLVDLSLYSDIKYGMRSYCHVSSGTTLNIQEGVDIEIMYHDSKQASDTYLLFELGSKANMNGTSDRPIRFYSTTGKPGSWAGIVMLGNAYIYDHDGVPLINQHLNIEDFRYGGIIDEHNGGKMNYVKIQHTGAVRDGITTDAFTLYGVGRLTLLVNITVANCIGGGVVLHGGTVNMTYLFVKEVGKVSLKYTNGWSGVMDGTFILNSYSDFEAAIISEGIDKLPHFHDIYCLSIVGGKCFIFKDNSGGNINNINRIGYEVDEEFLGANNPIITGLGVASIDTTRFNWASLF